ARDIAPTKIGMAMEPLVNPEAPPETHMTIGHIARFIVACTIAAVRLRSYRFEDTVRGIMDRKTKRACSKTIDIETARHLTAIFHRLRSFFPVNYLCLYDSLALIEFLASYQIFP